MTSIQTIRNALLAKKGAIQDRQDSGRFGEILIAAWLREEARLEVDEIPQSRDNKLIYVPENGKRPDFFVYLEDQAFLIDAKLHSIGSENIFSLNLDEIKKFRVFMEEWKTNILFIALIPRQFPDCLFLIGLDEIEKDNDFGAPGSFKVDLNDKVRRFGPFSKAAYANAERAFRAEGFTGAIPPYPASPTP